MLCTHYICSPMRNWTSPHRLKVYCLHLSAIGEYVPPLRIELRIFSLRGSSFNHSAIEAFNKTPVGDLNSHTTVLQTGTSTIQTTGGSSEEWSWTTVQGCTCLALTDHTRNILYFNYFYSSKVLCTYNSWLLSNLFQLNFPVYLCI